MPNTNGGWGDVDEGGWGSEWGVIAAAAEATTKTKASKKNQNQHQARTHNNTKKETKSTNERRKNADNPWGTNADGWGGGWADEAPTAPVAADNDPNTVADDNIDWDNSDNPWAQTDETQGIKIS